MLPITRSSSSRSAYGTHRPTGSARSRWKLILLLLAGVLATCFLIVFSDSAGPAFGNSLDSTAKPRRLAARTPLVKSSESQLFSSDSSAEQQQPHLPPELPGMIKGHKPKPIPVAISKKAGPPLPADFDWQTYLLYHPELSESGVLSAQQAQEHYQQHGKKQNLIYRKIRVIMRYTACTGLVNQLYSHIAALSLAAFLGAEVVLPPAAKRDSFAHYFSVFKEQNEVKWTSAPLESLLDVDGLISFWGQRGLRIHRAQALEPFPDLTEPHRAFVQHPFDGSDGRCTARLDDVYLRHLEMEDLVERARKAVVSRAEQLLQTEKNITVDHMVLDLPCTFFMLRSASNIPLVAEIAKSLQWSQEVQQLADRVVEGIVASGDTSFNSVHLRMEKDARDWALIMGGIEVVWSNYVIAMKQAGFNVGKGLYIASGLLTYGANDELDHLVSTMVQAGLCKKAHYKELYLPKNEIEALNSEQKALLDLLVLARGYSFVGFGSSTFSFYLREYRMLVGIPASRSILVDASVIGTDQLFAEAGKIT